jgi:hypothetical protein
MAASSPRESPSSASPATSSEEAAPSSSRQPFTTVSHGFEILSFFPVCCLFLRWVSFLSVHFLYSVQLEAVSVPSTFFSR